MKFNPSFRPPAISISRTPPPASPPATTTTTSPPLILLPHNGPTSPLAIPSPAPSSPHSSATHSSSLLLEQPHNPLLAPSSLQTTPAMRPRRSPRGSLTLQPLSSSPNPLASSSISSTGGCHPLGVPEPCTSRMVDDDFLVDPLHDLLGLKLEDGLPVTVSPCGVRIPSMRRASGFTTRSSNSSHSTVATSASAGSAAPFEVPRSVSSVVESTPGSENSVPSTPLVAGHPLDTKASTHMGSSLTASDENNNSSSRPRLINQSLTRFHEDDFDPQTGWTLHHWDEAEGDAWVDNRPEEEKIRYDDLKLGHIIGQGSQAIVRKVKHVPTGIIYAMKCIDLNQCSPTTLSAANTCGDGHHRALHQMKKTLQRELARLTATPHPNIVSYCEAYFCDNSLKLLMEYVNLGPLSSLLRKYGPFPMGILAPMMQQVVSGLQNLHESGILHRDLKPSNLLVTKKGIVKISDFGVSSAFGRQRTLAARTQIGSTAYMSPERIRGEPYGPSGDVWGLGVTCAECALGVFPFRPEDEYWEPDEGPFAQPLNMFDLSMLIGDGKAKVDWPTMTQLVDRYLPSTSSSNASLAVSPECQDFVARCTRQAPEARAPLADLAFLSFVTTTPTVEFAPWLQGRMDAKEAKGLIP